MKLKHTLLLLSFFIVQPTFSMEFPVPLDWNKSAPEEPSAIAQETDQKLNAIQNHPRLKLVIDGKEIDQVESDEITQSICKLQIDNNRLSFDSVLSTALKQNSTRTYMLNSLRPDSLEETDIIDQLKDRTFDKHENYFKKQRLNFFQRHYMATALFTGVACVLGKDYLKNIFTSIWQAYR